jgi:hypothetical protein
MFSFSCPVGADRDYRAAEACCLAQPRERPGEDIHGELDVLG